MFTLDNRTLLCDEKLLVTTELDAHRLCTVTASEST